jgi:hypothetical protein
MAWIRIRFLGLATGLLIAINAMSQTSNAGSFSELTDVQLNTALSLTATSNELAALAISLGGSGNALTIGGWTGTVNSSGWTIDISGSLGGVPLSIAETGVLNTLNQQATFTDSGILGSEAINGSGTVNGNFNWSQSVTKAGFDANISGSGAAVNVGLDLNQA